MEQITYRMILRRAAVFGTYTCTSSSRPGVVYDVDVRHASRPTCSCPAGRAGFRNCTANPFCQHVRLAMRMHAYRCKLRRAAAEREARGAPAPAPERTRPAGMAALLEAFV